LFNDFRVLFYATLNTKLRPIIPSVAVVPLVPDDLTVAGLPAIADVPGVDGVSAVAFPVVSDVPAVAAWVPCCFWLLSTVLLASLLILASIHNLAGIFTNCTGCTMRQLDYWTIGIRLSDCYVLLLSDYWNIEYWICEF
jgi:hypothetical protein